MLSTRNHCAEKRTLYFMLYKTWLKVNQRTECRVKPFKRQQIDSGGSVCPWSWPHCFESVEHHGADGIRAAYLTAAEKQKVTQEEVVGKAYVPRRCPKWWNFPHHYLLTDHSLCSHRWINPLMTAELSGSSTSMSGVSVGDKLLLHKSSRVFHVQPWPWVFSHNWIKSTRHTLK